MKRWLLVTAIMFGAITGARAQFASYTYSSQDILIGANIVQSGGVTGKGVTFGVIDTGVAAPWIGFSGGRVASTPTSVCVITPSCTQSLAVTDDNGHGTFVASEIIGSVPSAGFVGVAPGGNVISVKVLNAAGSGSYNDVASGIITAVNRGAQVLNLSLGPFVQNPAMIAAINYAASRNAYVVFAGGNSTQALNNGVNITGLTDSVRSMKQSRGFAEKVIAALWGAGATGIGAAGMWMLKSSK